MVRFSNNVLTACCDKLMLGLVNGPLQMWGSNLYPDIGIELNNSTRVLFMVCPFCEENLRVFNDEDGNI